VVADPLADGRCGGVEDADRIGLLDEVRDLGPGSPAED
jgi:hypothetical protein